jgi:hypothetical protein
LNKYGEKKLPPKTSQEELINKLKHVKAKYEGMESDSDEEIEEEESDLSHENKEDEQATMEAPQAASPPKRMLRSAKKEDKERQLREQQEREDEEAFQKAQLKLQKQIDREQSLQGRLRPLLRLTNPTSAETQERIKLEKEIAELNKGDVSEESIAELKNEKEDIDKTIFYADRSSKLTKEEKARVNQLYSKTGAPLVGSAGGLNLFKKQWAEYKIGIYGRAIKSQSILLDLTKKQKSKTPTFTGEVHTLTSGGGGARRPFAIDTSQDSSKQELKSPGGKKAQKDLDNFDIEVQRVIGGK